ncbi:MAG: chemotaxis response regulator protein-glutamate methylesterase [Bacillota bacterium]
MTVKELIKVFIVDDSAFMRRLFTTMLEEDPEIKVVGYAREGREALEKIQRLKPHVVTLDVEMPGMDGLTTLRELMDTNPLPVVMLSSTTTAGATNTIRALELGAVDFVPKPENRAELMLLGTELVAKIKLASGVTAERIIMQKKLCDGGPCPPIFPSAVTAADRTVPAFLGSKGQIELVAIGTSTGGPAALTEVFKTLPRNLPAGVIIAQHMPPGFTKSLAARLNDLGSMPVKEAEDGDLIQKGRAYLAPAGLQTEVERNKGEVKLKVFEKPPFPTLYKPSVDVLFLSVAKVYGSAALGVIMTGMGNDGTMGLKAIKEAAGQVLAQDEASSIVYGMPKSAVEAGVVDKILPLIKLSEEIGNLVKR